MSKSTAKQVRHDGETTDATDATARPVWLIFEGKTGKQAEFDQLGEHVLFSLDGDPLVLTPGLLPVTADAWDKWKRVPAVQSLIDSKALTVDESGELAAYQGRGHTRALASVTVNAEAIEHMLGLELGKPSSGRPGERRDPELIELLHGRMALAQRRRTIDMTGIVAQAKTSAQIHEGRAR